MLVHHDMIPCRTWQNSQATSSQWVLPQAQQHSAWSIFTLPTVHVAELASCGELQSEMGVTQATPKDGWQWVL